MNENESKPVETPPGGYIAVALASLRLDTETAFKIFLRTQSAKEPVLYRGAGVEFTAAEKKRLTDSGVTRILISSDEKDAYSRYLEANLPEMLADESIPLDDRVQSLYDCAQFVVRDVLSRPDARDVVPRSQKLVNATADLLSRDGGAFHSLLQATSVTYHVYTHSVNVFVYSMMLSRRLALGDESFLRRLGTGALLHDIGKSRINPAILNAERKLTAAEWKMMRKHPVWGCEMLRNGGIVDPMILEITRSHHEKLDGTGYPDGLTAEAIPAHVRAVTICDVFDALTTRRSYKDEVRTFDAIRVMQQEMKGTVDSDQMRVFVAMMATSS